jgi:hypothetical protein
MAKKKDDGSIVGGFIREGHGSDRGKPHIEVVADELPWPVPAQVAAPARPIERLPDGKLASSEAAKELGRLGGEAKARRVRMVDALGLSKLAESAAFLPYRTAAEEFSRHHLEELAEMSGGVVGAGPSSMVASAAIQLGASRFLFDKGSEDGDPDLFASASRLADSSRQNLLAAYALAVRAAELRNKSKSKTVDFDALTRQAVAETEARRESEKKARQKAIDAADSEDESTRLRVSAGAT